MANSINQQFQQPIQGYSNATGGGFALPTPTAQSGSPVGQSPTITPQLKAFNQSMVGNPVTTNSTIQGPAGNGTTPNANTGSTNTGTGSTGGTVNQQMSQPVDYSNLNNNPTITAQQNLINNSSRTNPLTDTTVGNFNTNLNNTITALQQGLSSRLSQIQRQFQNQFNVANASQTRSGQLGSGSDTNQNQQIQAVEQDAVNTATSQEAEAENNARNQNATAVNNAQAPNIANYNSIVNPANSTIAQAQANSAETVGTNILASGLDITDPDTLHRIAVQTGLTSAQIQQGVYQAQVARQTAQKGLLTSVPYGGTTLAPNATGGFSQVGGASQNVLADIAAAGYTPTKADTPFINSLVSKGFNGQQIAQLLIGNQTNLKTDLTNAGSKTQLKTNPLTGQQFTYQPTAGGAVSKVTGSPTQSAGTGGTAKNTANQVYNSAPDTFPNPQNKAQVAFQKAFTSGPLANTINAQNTAIGHLVDAYQLGQEMNNFNLTPANKGKNYLSTVEGQAAVQNYTQAHGLSSAELSSAYGQDTGAERDVNNSLANSSASPAQLKGYVDTSVKLLSSKILSNVQQYKTAYGQNAPLNVNWFIAPDRQAQLQQLGYKVHQVGSDIGIYQKQPDGSYKIIH